MGIGTCRVSKMRFASDPRRADINRSGDKLSSADAVNVAARVGGLLQRQGWNVRLRVPFLKDIWGNPPKGFCPPFHRSRALSRVKE